MARSIRIVTMTHDKGLHARPTMEFSTLAMGFACAISVRRTDRGETVDAKSMMAMLTLMVTPGTELEIEATGGDAEEAVTALAGFLEQLCDRPDQA